ncbi:hypothetical protein [Pseudonocardia sp. NPDC046786]|uniref:hypothetical protein n=1 Tax=Pseudonocardia sp. NPDC046786 TaxID=3155471 RepID=UPI0033E35F8A
MTSAPGQPGRDDAAEPDPDGLGEAIRTGRVPVVPGSLVDLVMRSGSARSPDAGTDDAATDDAGTADATGVTGPAPAAGPSGGAPVETSATSGPAASTGSGFADLVRGRNGRADASGGGAGVAPGAPSVTGPRPTPSPRPGPAAADVAQSSGHRDDTGSSDGTGSGDNTASGDGTGHDGRTGTGHDGAGHTGTEPAAADREAPDTGPAPGTHGDDPSHYDGTGGTGGTDSTDSTDSTDGTDGYYADLGDLGDDPLGVGPLPDDAGDTDDPLHTPADRFAPPPSFAPDVDASANGTTPVRTGSISAGPTGADRSGTSPDGATTDSPATDGPTPADRHRDTPAHGHPVPGADPDSSSGSTGPATTGPASSSDHAGQTGHGAGPAHPATTGDPAASTHPAETGGPAGPAAWAHPAGQADRPGSATNHPDPAATPGAPDAPADSPSTGRPDAAGRSGPAGAGDPAATPAAGRPRMGGDRSAPGDAPPTQPAPTVVPPIAPSPRPLDDGDAPAVRPVRSARADAPATGGTTSKRWPPRPGADGGPETDILPPGALLGHYPSASADTAEPGGPTADARPATPSSGVRPTMPGRRRPAPENTERESAPRPPMGGTPSGPAMAGLSGNDLFATPGGGGTGRGFGELPGRTARDAEQGGHTRRDDTSTDAGHRGDDRPAEPGRPDPRDEPARGAPVHGSGGTGRNPLPTDTTTAGPPARRGGPGPTGLTGPTGPPRPAGPAGAEATGGMPPTGSRTGAQPYPRPGDHAPWAAPDGRSQHDPARRAPRPAASDATVTIPALDDDGRPRHAITPPPGRGPRPVTGRPPQDGPAPSARHGRDGDGTDATARVAAVFPAPARTPAHGPAHEGPPPGDAPRPPEQRNGTPAARTTADPTGRHGTDSNDGSGSSSTDSTDSTDGTGGAGTGNIAAAASVGAVSVAAARAASGRDGAVTGTGPRTEVRPAADQGSGSGKPITPRREAIMSAKPRNGRRGVSPAGLAIALAIVLLGTLTLWAMFSPGSDGDGTGADRAATEGTPAAGLGPRPDAGPAAASASRPTVRATVGVGAEPVAVAATADGRTALVAVADDPRLLVLDGATDTVTAEILLPATPQGVTTSPDGARAFVSLTGPEGGQLAVVDVPGASVIGTTSTTADPAGAVVAPDGRFLYVPSRTDGVVDELDPYAGTVTRSVPVSRDPFAAAGNDTGDRIYLATRGADQLTVLDPSSLTVLRSYPVRGGAEAVAVSAGPETQVAVGGPDSDTVTVLDPTDGREVAGVETRGGPTGLAFAPDGRHLYAVTDQGLQVIRTSTWRVAGTTDVALNPTAIAVSADGRTGWVTGDGEVSVLDLGS